MNHSVKKRRGNIKSTEARTVIGERKKNVSSNGDLTQLTSVV